MPTLMTMTGREVMPPIVLVAGGRMRLKIMPLPGERLPFRVNRTRAPLVAVERLDNRVGPNFATFTLSAQTAGETEIQIEAASGGAPLRVGVRVLGAISLPPASTVEGMLTRLLLAETRAPGGSGYSPGDAAESMRLMRVVLENRLATPSGRWASAGARAMGDVVRARGQFHGFEGYPDLPDGIEGLIGNMVEIANNSSDGRQPGMRAHVQLAISTASGERPSDPTRQGLYWWRTEGSGAPGTGISRYKSVLGNTFYREGN
jgi:hypothetical protein